MWLEFLLDCSKKDEEPDRNEIIKKGYESMKVSTWSPDTKALYWKQKMNELDLIETQEELRREAFEKGIEKG